MLPAAVQTVPVTSEGRRADLRELAEMQADALARKLLGLEPDELAGERRLQLAAKVAAAPRLAELLERVPWLAAGLELLIRGRRDDESENAAGGGGAAVGGAEGDDDFPRRCGTFPAAGSAGEDSGPAGSGLDVG